MKISLTNWTHNGKLRQYEWDIKPFFDGTICSKDSLRRINEFTEKDKRRLKELEEARENPMLEGEEYKLIMDEFMSLIFKKDVEEWEGLLFEEKVKIHITIGWVWNDSSEYEEILCLEGDKHLVECIPIKASLSGLHSKPFEYMS